MNGEDDVEEGLQDTEDNATPCLVADDDAVPISPLCRLIWVVTQAFGLHVDLT
jgi:hypothetical protein